jgi:ABC-2 type transport system ATP-binding protein
MTDHPIEIIDLHKSFGSVKALDGLHLTVRPGEVTGFLGPNGAGKSTTIRVLLGFQRSDSGTARVFGGDVWRDAVVLHRRLAYVPGDVSLWPNLTGGEAIEYLARLHRNRSDAARQKARKAELLERFELDPTKKARTYSTGNRQKVALVAASLPTRSCTSSTSPPRGLIR